MLKKILSYYWRSFTAIIIIFAVVGVSFSYSAQTVQSMKIQADQALDQQWRTDYDLLVSPSPNSFEYEGDKNRGLIRRSDMSNLRGGIARAQYEQIKALEEVEVAAPLSFLGYIMAKTTFPLFRSLDKTVYIMETETEIFDGMRYRKIPERQARNLSNVKYIDPNISFNDKNTWDLIRLLGWSYNSTITVPFRSEYYWSVIGIDPEEEKKLLNLDSTVVEGEFLPDQKDLLKHGELPLLPILLQKKSYDVKRSVQLDEVIDDELKKYISDPVLYKDELIEFNSQNPIEELPRETLWKITFNPYSEDLLYFYGQLEIKNGELMKGTIPSISVHPNAYIYELGELKHDVLGEFNGVPLYRAVPFAAFGEQINYRSIDQTLGDKGFGYDIYGLFDPTLLNNPYSTSLEPRSPDFYNPDPVYITHDTKGNAYEERVRYHSPPNKEGYSTGGVDALTTLEAAEYFLGDEPISVIRVVVAGAGERSRESMAKVERVAEQIRKETGLHVNVMLGAADHKVQVLLDDFKGVPGYGYLLEGWSQAGASFTIENRVDSTNLLLSGYILLMGLIGVSLVYRNYVEIRRKDIMVQYTYGWKKLAILKQLLIEGGLILLFVSIILLISKITVGISWTWIQFGIASGVLGFIALLCILVMYVIPLMKGLEQKTNLRTGGQVILPVLTNSPNLTLWGYLGHTLIRYGVRTLLKLLILVSTMIYVFLFLITKARSSSFLMLTFLGEDINLVLEPHQWVLFGLGLVLSIGSYIALQMNQMEKRTQEIQLYQAWGWPVKRWLSIFLLEELVITALAILFGGLVGSGLWSTLANTVVITPFAIILLILSAFISTIGILAFTLSTRSKRNQLREFN